MRCWLLLMLLMVPCAGADIKIDEGPPGLLLLSVDTLRADFLGCYGCIWDISPNIDRLAAEARVFDNAQCEMPLTGPSFAAMFSSQYPRTVGATRNGMRVSSNAVLVAEIIQAAGYHTFAVQSNWTLRGRLSGLDRGFDHYDESFPQRRWGFYKGERRAEELALAAVSAIESLPKDKPFFGWIHFTDPHAPYRFRRDFSPVPGGLRGLNRTEQVRVKYASEVAYTDHYIGKVLDALPENTIIVFVADHGENLYEHGYLGHGRYLYQPCMHVPLFVRAPGVAPSRSDAPVQTLDISPTLLGLLKLDRPESMLGRDIVNESIPRDRPRFMETYGGAVPRLPGAKQFLRDTSPTQESVVQAGWKLMRSTNRPPALFYLPDDPGEIHNRYGRYPDKAETLNDLLDIWDATHGHGGENVAELDEEDIEALQSLGYLD